MLSLLGDLLFHVLVEQGLVATGRVVLGALGVRSRRSDELGDVLCAIVGGALWVLALVGFGLLVS